MVSKGCSNCFALRDSHRLAGNPNPKIHEVYNGLTEKKNGVVRWTGKVKLVRDRLDQPLRWKRPRKIFVNSMSDLFHEDLPIEDIYKVLITIGQCHLLMRGHIFMVLTKRPDRMCAVMKRFYKESTFPFPNPLPNLWLGTSTENQEWADRRIPHLLETPAAIRFLSCEPLLGRISLQPWFHGMGVTVSLRPLQVIPAIDWVVVGGESGPKARPMHPDWAISLRDQCVEANVPFFFKQKGAWTWDVWEPKADDIAMSPGGHIVQSFKCARPNTTYTRMQKVGKKKAGRLLDGREWNQTPGQQGGYITEPVILGK
jgi:protein gp37